MPTDPVVIDLSVVKRVLMFQWLA